MGLSPGDISEREEVGGNLASASTFKVLELKKTHPKLLYSLTSLARLMGVLGSCVQGRKAGEAQKEEHAAQS